MVAGNADNLFSFSGHEYPFVPAKCVSSEIFTVYIIDWYRTYFPSVCIPLT